VLRPSAAVADPKADPAPPLLLLVLLYSQLHTGYRTVKTVP